MNAPTDYECRQSVEDAIERLAVRLNSASQSDLSDHAKRIIDEVAGYLGTKHTDIPDTCLKHLGNATRAVPEGRFPRVIHELHQALDVSDRLSTRKPSLSLQKPMKKHTDKLLAALKRTKPPTS